MNHYIVEIKCEEDHHVFVPGTWIHTRSGPDAVALVAELSAEARAFGHHRATISVSNGRASKGRAAAA